MSVRGRAPGAPASVIEQDGREAGPDSNALSRVSDGQRMMPGANGGLLKVGGNHARPGPTYARKRQAIIAAVLKNLDGGDVCRVVSQLLADATNLKVKPKDRSTAARVLFDFLGKPTIQEQAAAGVGPHQGQGPTVFIFDHDPVAIKRV